ncbi:MAG TPA: biotin/lipoyl-binding protein, partial [Vicinamibacterales bacterium]
MRNSLIAGAAAIALVACHRGAETAAEKKATVNANVVTVTRQPFAEVVGSIGSVSARAGHAASLSAPSPGRISSILVTSGQTVAAGQPLIELEQAPFELDAQSALSALDAAQKAYDRQERLANEGIV